MFKKIHFPIVAALLFTVGTAHSQEGAWTIKQPLPAPRNEVALAAVGSKLYVVGGSVGGEAVPLIDEYDPPSNGWRAGKAMPKGLDHLGVAVIGNKIITVGGFIGSVHRGAVHGARRQGARDRWTRRRQHVHRRVPRGL